MDKKLEEKLNELGYKYNGYNESFMEYDYIKPLSNVAELHMYYSKETKSYYGLCLTLTNIIYQKVIDNLQVACNQLEKDLEVLKDE